MTITRKKGFCRSRAFPQLYHPWVLPQSSIHYRFYFQWFTQSSSKNPIDKRSPHYLDSNLPTWDTHILKPAKVAEYTTLLSQISSKSSFHYSGRKKWGTRTPTLWNHLFRAPSDEPRPVIRREMVPRTVVTYPDSRDLALMLDRTTTYTHTDAKDHYYISPKPLERVLFRDFSEWQGPVGR